MVTAGASRVADRRSPVIRTPDQRLRVFISSTLTELAPERRAARDAVEGLRLAPVMFEAGARPHPPRALYRAYLEQSHVFVGVYWQSYGWVAPEMGVSGIEDEYLLSAPRPSLIYLKEPAPAREPRLQALLDRMSTDDRVSFTHFESPQDLAWLLASDLMVLLSERFEETAGPGGGRVLAARQLPVPPTPLVGREQEVAGVVSLLSRDDVRLVTLTGPGGVGKTRLALEAATRLASRHRDGAFLADLAPVREADAVPLAVAQAVGMRGEGQRPVRESVVDGLGAAQALLVLDNFEQVRAAGPFVAELLAGCPGVQVLVTSRAPLRVRGEHEVPVQPLAVPPAGVPTGARDVLAAPATRLFVERAAESSPGFRATDENAAAVAELCRRVDGLPLAIELAAARVRVLPPAALLERLGGRLDLPPGPADLPERQRTLRATLDWSHDLLDSPTQRLFARLSVFASGFTLAAAEEVCRAEGEPDVLEGVATLVERSLVTVTEVPGLEPRFRMLETVREYAAERLAAGGGVDEGLAGLAAYLVRFVATAGEGLATARHREWVQRVAAEVGNLNAAGMWAVRRGDLATAIRLWMPPWIAWWVLTTDLPGTRRLLESLYPRAERLEPELFAMYLWGLAGLRHGAGDFDGAVRVLRELAGLQHALGDERGEAYARALLALSFPYPVPPEMRDLMSLAAETFRRTGDCYGTAYVVKHMGELAVLDGDLDRAEQLLAEALECATVVDSDEMAAQVLNYLALLAVARGRLEEAHARVAQSVRMFESVRFWREGVDYALDTLAALAMALGRPVVAGQALGAARAMRQTAGLVVWPFLRQWNEQLKAQVESALGAGAFQAAARAGAVLRPEEAVARALAATAPDDPSPDA